ncbi:MAG: hypothetical protein WDM79_02675 [Terricaulis sp.]
MASIVRSLARALSGADGATVVLKRGDRVAYVDEDAIGPCGKAWISDRGVYFRLGDAQSPDRRD